jgi:hypothetical protein
LDEDEDVGAGVDEDKDEDVGDDVEEDVGVGAGAGVEAPVGALTCSTTLACWMSASTLGLRRRR